MLIMSSFFFGKKSAQSKVDYKSRLEYKLYLAREDPEPLFDLSECGLKTVPTGIYSLCKVFRKEKLLLQINRLTSLSGGGVLTDLCLVTVLHLQNNQFSSLPEDIVHLKNLKELNVSNNVLKKLPDSIGSLAKLRVLDCSHNKLQSLPTSFGQLHSLATLDLRDNPGIFIFPPCLIQLKGLVELLVDQQLLKDVPSDILQQGVSAILEFYDKEKTGTKLCCEEEKMEAPDTPKKSSSTLQENQDKQSFAQVSLMLLEKRKQEKAEDLLKIEKQLQKQRETEFELHQNTKQDKNKIKNEIEFLGELAQLEKYEGHEKISCKDLTREEGYPIFAMARCSTRFGPSVSATIQMPDGETRIAFLPARFNDMTDLHIATLNTGG